MNKYSIALSAGEASGDLHGSNLVNELRTGLGCDVHFWGGGGAGMRRAGVDLIVDTSGGGTIGVVETLASLPGVIANYHKLKRELITRKPDLFIPIDFGAFNIRLAKVAAENNIKVVYYIPPGSWRRGARAVDGLKACGSKVVTPFPWSAENLKAAGIDARWPGHPLIDIVKPTCSKDDFYRENNLHGLLISMFPGSRSHETGPHFQPLMDTVNILSREISDVSFVIGAASNADKLQIKVDNHLKSIGCKSRVVVLQGQTYNCMAYSDAAVVTSGTATLEAAILGTPMVIIYRGTALMRFEFLFRKGVVESYIGLPNIISGSLIVPEMLGENVTGENICREILDIIRNPDRMNKMKAGFDSVREILGGQGSLKRAAEAVIDLASLDRNVNEHS